MKIKINNVFKNLNENKEKIKIKRRKNIDKIMQIDRKVLEVEKDKVENKEYTRKGANNNKNVLDILKTFIGRFTVKRNYYVLFGLMIILAAVSVYTNFMTYREKNNESYAVFNSNDEANKSVQVESSISEDLQDLTSNNIDTRKDTENNNVATSVNKTVVSNTNAKKNTSEKVTIIPLSFIKPINGEIIKTYSIDTLLFSKTLELWKTHDGVDIKAALGESVKSAEKGLVEKVYEDSFLGMTIIIDHGQGYKSIYSNLDSNVNVKEKQIVKKAAIIGKIGITSIGEIKDEPHIHFMLMFNNKVIDPTSKIKF